MVTWFFENNHFANAWIPFDRTNQKKLEYVYQHHEEIIKHMNDKEAQSAVAGLIQQQDTAITNGKSTHLSKIHSNNIHPHTTTEKNNHSDSKNNTATATAASTIPTTCIIREIDPDEEDSSVHSLIQYSHNCLYIKLVDSHFEQPITLYPALLLGSLPDRDFLIIRAEMTDHKRSQTERYFFLTDI